MCGSWRFKFAELGQPRGFDHILEKGINLRPGQRKSRSIGRNYSWHNGMEGAQKLVWELIISY